MGDELDDDISLPPGAGSGSANPAALIAALEGDAASTKEAREFLRRQTALTNLQTRILHEQNAFELSHLRWRRLGDQMKGALQILILILGSLLLIAIGATLWDASNAGGVVVQSFSAPPDFAARGIGGDVVASDLTNRIAAIRRNGALTSYSSAQDVRSAREDEIRMEIPDTGISLGEVWRYLRGWLGHERILEGNLRDLGNGRIALTAALAGEDSFTLTGGPADLDHMEQQAAERIFSGVDPVNYTIYLVHQRRFRDAEESAARHAQTAATPAARADAYTLWAATSVWAGGDPAAALARVKIGLSIDPHVAVAHVYAARMYDALGDEEQALAEARSVMPLRDADQPEQHRGRGLGMMRTEARAAIDGLLGDFGAQGRESASLGDSYSVRLLSVATAEAKLHNISASRALLAEAQSIGGAGPDVFWQARYHQDEAAGNWKSEAADLATVLAAGRSIRSQFFRTAATQSETYRIAATEWWPLLARAYAGLGDFRRAHELIDATSGNCYDCLRMRGNIAGAERHLGGAEYWYSRAVEWAPSIPFAYADWGAMLLAKGDYDGAIAKFALAHEKGPHFADPIEMWGEALIDKNRSDLAIAKFEEANKYAPSWGRLHLEWGRALLWTGDKAGARQQFEAAAHLDLSARDSATLRKLEI